jgi:hypothetical protein
MKNTRLLDIINKIAPPLTSSMCVKMVLIEKE